MRSKLGAVCMVLGVVLLIGALSLFLYNHHEAKEAEAASAQIMPQLLQRIEQQQPTPPSTAPEDPPGTGPVPEASTAPGISPAPLEPDTLGMTEVEIDGHSYIGYLSIPSRDLELPVMSDWDDAKMKIAPCRYSGTLKGENLVILGHNYARHFRPLQNITVGELVFFVDAEGNTTGYEVVALDVLAPTAVEEMTAGNYDLTLFTCTYGGQNRLTVYCDLVGSG